MFGEPFNFVIHLSTSDLVTQLVVDPEALRNEHHEPGVFDEEGDYYPQYSDDPDDLKYIGANSGTSSDPGTSGDSEPTSSEPLSEPSSSDTLSDPS